MQAGLLNKMIEFKSNEPVIDEFGGRVNNWVTVKNTRANVKFNSGNRKNANNEVYNTVVNTFSIRKWKGISTKMNIHYDGNKYKILSLHHDEKMQATIIIAELINE